jgi:hypothetical protein
MIHIAIWLCQVNVIYYYLRANYNKLKLTKTNFYSIIINIFADVNDFNVNIYYIKLTLKSPSKRLSLSVFTDHITPDLSYQQLRMVSLNFLVNSCWKSLCNLYVSFLLKSA